PSPGADAEAWERLWARSQLVLHASEHTLSCSLLGPCDLPAELVPCWQLVPGGPCQALPGLQQPALGQGPQEFGGLQPHPNLCIQVWSSGQVRLTQCLRDREYCWGGRAGTAPGSGWGMSPPGFPLPAPSAPGTSPGVLPGHSDDLLLLERRGNASLCALVRGTCTPLASFTSTGAGHPGLLEQELQRDLAAGHCRQVSVGSRWGVGQDWAACDVSPCPQIWYPENSTGVVLWACPLHKYLRARWALAWMGVLLGATCLLLLLLLKKEDMKGERCLSRGCAHPGT
ncbi:I17RC protein, partial [Bucorvus abyssinicus]|nr:I17RC protein [Bucorvus abyssinicus]